MDIKHYKVPVTIDTKSFKANDDGSFYVSGIANNKNQQDDYGDIPTNFNGNPVYDFSRFKGNPISLINHSYDTSSIVGSYTKHIETDKGLEFTFKSMAQPETLEAKHAIQAIKEGHLRSLSIGGKWFFEDPENPNNLTKAFIYEISWVTIPADANAVSNIPIVKSVQTNAENIDKNIREFINGNKKDETLLRKIYDEINKEIKNKNENS